MKKLFKNEIGKWWLATVCLGFLPIQNHAAQYVEISVEIETFGYRLTDTNSIARAKQQTVHVICITGPNEWYIEHDFSQRAAWKFDGTNVCCRLLSESENSQRGPEGRKQVWKSRDGHPLGDFGANLPWLAFCSGTYLKREGRIIP